MIIYIALILAQASSPTSFPARDILHSAHDTRAGAQRALIEFCHADSACLAKTAVQPVRLEVALVDVQ